MLDQPRGQYRTWFYKAGLQNLKIIQNLKWKAKLRYWVSKSSRIHISGVGEQNMINKFFAKIKYAWF